MTRQKVMSVVQMLDPALAMGLGRGERSHQVTRKVCKMHQFPRSPRLPSSSSRSAEPLICRGFGVMKHAFLKDSKVMQGQNRQFESQVCYGCYRGSLQELSLAFHVLHRRLGLPAVFAAHGAR